MQYQYDINQNFNNISINNNKANKMNINNPNR